MSSYLWISEELIMNYMEIAQTILRQLGGSRFTSMTGAKDFLAVPDPALSFRLPGRPGFVKDGINYVKITLRNDLYDMEFSRIAGPSKHFAKTNKAMFEGIFADQLQAIFARATGLDTHL